MKKKLFKKIYLSRTLTKLKLNEKKEKRKILFISTNVMGSSMVDVKASG